MKKWLGYLLFCLCSYALFVIATLPASQLYHFAKERLPNVALQHVEGTIWDGSAKQIRINKFEVGPIYWRFKPLSLLLGEATFQLSTNEKKLKATGSAGINFTGEPFISKMKGEGPIKTLLSLFPATPITPEGRIAFDIKEALFHNQRLNSITGTIDWQHAGVKQPIKIQIGNLNIALNTDKSGIHGKISDKNATIAVNGQLELLPSGEYQINGKIQPKPDTPQDLLNALNILGQPDPTGAIPLSYSGKI